MLPAGSSAPRDYQELTRRTFLRAGTAMPLAATLTQTSLAAAPRKANSVLLLWLFGGPSHLDLVDPKPNAPIECRGPFGTISTRIPGVHFTELLPKLAARSDRFSLVRTNTNFTGSHRPAGSIGLTGSVATDGGEDAKGSPSGYPPNFGSILARHREVGDLPGFISVGRNHPGDGNGVSLGYGGGKWGMRHDPFLVSCSKSSQVSLPSLELLEGLTSARLTGRRSLLNELDSDRRRIGRIDRSEYRKWNALRKQAYALLNSADTVNAFDLSGESAETHSLYGLQPGSTEGFGWQCLVARRLAERGVRFIELIDGDTNIDSNWDAHAKMSTYNKLSRNVDQPIAALLKDLKRRGMLEETLVVWTTEFGRGVFSQNPGAEGRGHHSRNY